jgi:hypothetical protein
MQRLVDAESSKLTSSDAVAVKKWWRAVLVIYASVTFITMAAAVITSSKAHLQDVSGMTADASGKHKVR